MIIALFSWICELLRFELYVARIWLGLCLLSLGVWVLLSLLFRMLDILVIMIVFFSLSMFTNLSCVEHIIPTEICLIDMCLHFRDFVILTIYECPWFTMFT